MRTALFASFALALLASFALGTPRSIGGVATMEIPTTWSFLNSGDAFSFVAKSPSEDVTIRIVSTVPNSQPDLAAKTVDGIKVLLDMALSKIELEYIYDTVSRGYVPVSIGQPTSSFGGNSSGDSYSSWRSNTYDIYWENNGYSGTFNEQVVTKAIFDGNRIYLIRYWASEFASSTEQTQGLEILNDGFRSTKVGNPDADSDGDYLSNDLEVLILRSNPLLKDTNGDGISDIDAYDMDLNPNENLLKLKQHFKENPNLLGLLEPQIYVKTTPVKLAAKKQATYAIDDNFRATQFLAKGLPPGLTVNAKTGIISGIPTKRGYFKATVYANGILYGSLLTKQATVRFQVE